MRRREFIAGIGSAAAWPVKVRAQQAATPVVGFLSSVDYKVTSATTAAFLQGLKEAGYLEGQNMAVEYRYADNQYDRLPSIAADLVRRRVAVIAAMGAPAALAAKAATTTIPIVLSPPLTRSSLVLSPASTGRARTSPAAPVLVASCRQNDCNCSAS